MGSERNLTQSKEKSSSQSSLKSQKREIKLFSVVAYCVWRSHPIYTLVRKMGSLAVNWLAGFPSQILSDGIQLEV